MFTSEFYVDSIQSAKKQFVNTFVTNATVKDALNSFVDAQAAYTKSAIKTASDVNLKIAAEATKVITEATKVDFTKFDATKFFKGAK